MGPIPCLTFCDVLCAYVCGDPQCQVVVKLGNIKTHLRRKQGVENGQALEHENELLKLTEGKKPHDIADRYFKDPYPRKGEQPLSALPVFDLIQCPLCSAYFTGTASCRAHLRSKHRSHDHYEKASKEVQNFSPIKGQALFRGMERLYFPVTVRNTNAFFSSDQGFQSILGSIDDERSPTSKKADALSVRDKSANLTCSIIGVPDFLDANGITLNTAYDLSRTHTSYHSRLVILLIDYIEYFATRQLPIPSDVIEGLKIKNGERIASFSLGIEMRSKKRYAEVGGRFLLLVENLRRNPLQNLPLDPKLSSLAERIVESLEHRQKPDLALLHSFFCSLLLQEVRASKGEVVTIEGLFKLLIAGYTCGLTSKRIRVGDSQDASHTAAAMQYFCHLAGLGEFLEEPVGFGNSTSETEEYRLKRVRNTLSTDTCTPAAYLRMVLSKTKALSAGENPNIEFVRCPKHPFCGLVDDIEVPLDSDSPGSLGFTVRKISGDVRKILRQDLMRNFDIPTEFLETVLSFPDRLNEREPGYFFGRGEKAEETVRVWSESFARHLTSGVQPLIDVVYENDSCKYLVTSSASEWLRITDQLSLLLYTLVHLCGGGPPRVSEMVEAKLKNVAGSRRNIYILKQSLVLIGTYSKTSKQYTMPKPIARFLDRQTSELLLLFIVFIKPVQSFILGQSMSDVRATDDYLFCQSGEKMSDDSACRAFARTLSSKGLPLNLSLYRQYRAGVAKAILTPEPSDEKEQLVFQQAGHTEATARCRYAAGDFHVGNLSLAKLEGFYKISAQWHKLIGVIRLSKKKPKEIVQKSLIAAPNRTSTSAKGATWREKESKTRKVHASEDQIYGNKRKVLHRSPLNDPQEMSANKRQCVVSSRRQVVGMALDIPGTLTQSVLGASAKILGVLSTKGIRFKSEAQRAATFECAMQTVLKEYRSSMVVVLPTGGGKTLRWAVPALREQEISDKLCIETTKTILIVPLISLQQEMYRKCGEYGIRCGFWKDRFRRELTVVVCSIEILFTNEYARYITALSVQQKVGRLILDEAHLLLLWEDLRRFKVIGEKIRTKEAHELSIVCLSATLPDPVIPKLREILLLDVSCMKTYRASSSRPNIQYLVENFPFASSEKMIAYCSQVMSAELKSMKQRNRAIAFCLTIKDCVTLYEMMRNKFKACLYHGSLTLEERESSYGQWIDQNVGQPVVMFATSAFSCGIDYPHVKTVLDVGGVRSLLELGQESGRAGRDGRPSKNRVIYNAEYMQQRTVVESSSEAQMRRQNMFGDVATFLSGSERCRRKVLESFLNNEMRGPCVGEEQRCDVCLHNEQDGWKTVCSEELRGQQKLGIERNMVSNRKRVAALMGPSAIARRWSESILDSSKWKAKQMALSRCAVCLFTGAKNHVGSHMDCMRAKCFRCLESNASHQSKNCPLTPRGDNTRSRCFFCGIPRDQQLHDPKTYNKREHCEWLVAKNLALLAFRTTEHRRELSKCVPELQSAQSLKELGYLLCGGGISVTKFFSLQVVDYLYSEFVLRSSLTKQNT